MYIQGVYKVPYHPYISETVQNFETSRNTYSIVSRGYSFKGIGDVALPKEVPQGGPSLIILNGTPPIIVYHLKGHKKRKLVVQTVG